jgi:serine kinase of HPr protein (carbohydrate metabolism regulator)
MAALSSETLHASCVAIGGRGVLIEGASGAGKSDLSLRLIDRGAVLISDDYCHLRREGGTLIASPPPTIAGKIEVRGVGIVETTYQDSAPVSLLVVVGEPAARLPEPGAARSILGIDVPFVALDALHASAPVKVELALAQIP